MILYELTGTPADEYSLSNAVVFHKNLNPLLFDNNQLKSDIRTALLKIAKHFEEFIGIKLKIVDITISGSNAAYSYTPRSDIDLHIVVEVPSGDEYKELLDAKKNQYNAQHDIKVKGIDVELYAQDSEQKHHSLGIYSLMNNQWVSEPKREQPAIDSEDVINKYKSYRDQIRTVIKSNNIDMVKHVWDTVKKIRQSGLEKHGEFGTENLVFKMLRSQGWLEKLNDHILTLKDTELSVEDWQLD
jgi:predicted nucleotidyltransferase